MTKNNSIFSPTSAQLTTKGGIRITRLVETIASDVVDEAAEALVKSLDQQEGCFFESAYEYPGRYARWTMGFNQSLVKLEFKLKTYEFRVIAQNTKGQALLPLFHQILVDMVSSGVVKKDSLRLLKEKSTSKMCLVATVLPLSKDTEFSEEKRSKQPSVFSIIRKINEAFFLDSDNEDPNLGLYGAFGYDLAFQFDTVKLNKTRMDDQRDLVLYLPERLLIKDNHRKDGYWFNYTFAIDGIGSSIPLASEDADLDMPNLKPGEVSRKQGDYAKKVTRAKEEFKAGRLFEAVVSQVFRHRLKPEPNMVSELFQTLKQTNPSPYMFCINLGSGEYLVGTSPEMFVRVNAATSQSASQTVETCPISGTISRGKNALEDAEQIKSILTNRKEESELTMCTDVDRNDKSRICKAGTVKVIGRRQIEQYSKLFHTVDHVVGELCDDMDALDAFLVHMWAVTVTGAPKLWAMQFVENQEESPRRWYAGAVGMMGFNGGMNTGMTLRTIRVRKFVNEEGKEQAIAEVRAGATLLFDSDPVSEELETELKASAMIETILSRKKTSTINGKKRQLSVEPLSHVIDVKEETTIVVCDHEDSFVNTLASYFKQLSSSPLFQVITIRHDSINEERLQKLKPALLVLSPGPGTPKDFAISSKIEMCERLKIPIFGVCLGLQGIVEHFGGKLDILDYPMHGKQSTIKKTPRTELDILQNLPDEFKVGRYHSIFAVRDLGVFPKELDILASTVDVDGTEGEKVMAVQHKNLPIAAVQFHPESIMTSPELGLQIVQNAVTMLNY